MKSEVFHITNHNIVEIEKTRPLGNMGISKETWYWEIKTVRNKENDSKGSAECKSRNVYIDWTDLKTIDPLVEMTEICKHHMQK